MVGLLVRFISGNPEVPGSNPGRPIFFFLFFLNKTKLGLSLIYVYVLRVLYALGVRLIMQIFRVRA